MRIGFLGAAGGNADAVRFGVEYLIFGIEVDRVVYLASGDEFDLGIEAVAARLLGRPASPSARWARALELAQSAASAEQLDDALGRELQLRRLRDAACLMHDETRSMELLSERLLVMAASKEALLEIDFQEADLIIYGNAPVPLVRRAGKRTFLAPGPLHSPSGAALALAPSGVLVCEDDEGGTIVATISDAAGNIATSVALPARALRKPPADGLAAR